MGLAYRAMRELARTPGKQAPPAVMKRAAGPKPQSDAQRQLHAWQDAQERMRAARKEARRQERLAKSLGAHAERRSGGGGPRVTGTEVALLDDIPVAPAVGPDGGSGTREIAQRDAAAAEARRREAVAAADLERELFAAELREALEEAERYLRFAGTLRRPSDGEEYFGWGDDRQLWAALLWAFAAATRLPCGKDEHAGPKIGAHEDGGKAGDLAWRALGRFWVFARPSDRVGAKSKHGAGSGKTALMKRVGSLTPLYTTEDTPTGPGVARLLGTYHQTIGLDESGALFGTNAAMKKMVMSLMLTGFERGTSTTHAWGQGINANSTFGPVLLAANASMAATDSEQMGMLLSRTISIEALKAPDGFRAVRLSPGQEAKTEGLRDHIRDLMGRLAPYARYIQVDMPEWMDARTADAWEPLFAVAGLAGGEWPERVLEVAGWCAHGGREKAREAGRWAAVKGTDWVEARGSTDPWASLGQGREDAVEGGGEEEETRAAASRLIAGVKGMSVHGG